MSDLFVDRFVVEVFFMYSGVDFFGLFYIKEGRKELKRYGVLFICMFLRVVYLEIVNFFDISLFINVLCRFLLICGLVK